VGIAVGILSIGATELEIQLGDKKAGGKFTPPPLDIRRCKNTWTLEG